MSELKTAKDLPACPVETTLTLIGDKWKVLILRDLLPGSVRQRVAPPRAVHAGHLDIHEHEVEAPSGRAFKQIEHIQAVPGALDRGARRSDDLLRYLADDLVVFRK